MHHRTMHVDKCYVEAAGEGGVSAYLGAFSSVFF